MPYQYQGDVDPVYEPVLTIADTGEVLTEAQLLDTALGLANRIEFIRQLVPAASTTPEAFATCRDDFFGALWDETGDTLSADLLWRTESTGSPAISASGGEPRRPGQLLCSMPPDSTFSMGFGAPTDGPFGSLSFRRVSFVLAVEDDVANLATSVGAGLKSDWSALNGGDDSIQLVYSKSAANWRLIVRRATVQTTTDTGVPFVSGEFVTCQLIKNGNDIDVELNGSIVHTVASGSGPTGNLNFGFFAASSVADTEVLVARLDLIDILTAVSTGSRAD
jgi:hypothetical protein